MTDYPLDPQWKNSKLASDDTRVHPNVPPGKDGVKRFVYDPHQFVTRVTPYINGTTERDPDAGAVPTCAPRGGVYCIEGSFRTFSVEIVRQSVELRAGQRYGLKVIYDLQYNPTPGGDTDDVLYTRFFAATTADRRDLDWKQDRRWENGLEHFALLHCNQDCVLDLGVEFWSKWASTDAGGRGGHRIREFQLLLMPVDYGSPGDWLNLPIGSMYVPGQLPPSPIVVPPVPVPVPTPTPLPLPVPSGFPVISFPVPTGNIGSITPAQFCHAAAMFYGALAEHMGVTL